MEDFYEDILNRINKTIYEQDKPYGPKDFFSQVFKIDIKIDYPEGILKKLSENISKFISVFHFFWEETNIMFDSTGVDFSVKNNSYNQFRDAYSEGIYDILNSLLLLSIGSPIQSTLLLRRAFEGLIEGFYNITKLNSDKIKNMIENMFGEGKLTKLFEENQEYKNLKDFLEHQLTSLEMKQAYDRIKSKIENNRQDVKKNIYFIYERLSDYTHIYERNKNISAKELQVIHAHEPSFDKFDEPNDLFNLTCGFYISFLFVSIEILHSNKEITNKEYNEITERFVN